MSLNEKQVGFS